MAGAANFGRWVVEDLVDDKRRRWCKVLVRPRQQHLRDQIHPEIEGIFHQIVQIDGLLEDSYNWLLNAPLIQLRNWTGLTAGLTIAYRRSLIAVLPNGVVTPIEECLRNMIRDRVLLIDENVPLPYQTPPVGARDIEDDRAFDWAEWADNTMTDGDDEAIAAQVLFQLRPEIVDFIHPWATHRLRKELTQRAWTIVANSFTEEDSTVFTQNAAWIVLDGEMRLIDVLMSLQFTKFMEPRMEAGLPVLDTLIEFTD